MKSCYRAVIYICVCGLMLTGCKGLKGGKNGEGVRIGEPEPLKGDFGLIGGAPFDEIGQRINGPAVQFGAVMFSYDSYRIASSEIPKMERVANYMRRNSHVVLVSGGHCDERGSREYNMSLGEHRALAIRAYLIRLGIKDSRIQTRSYGEERPVDGGHSEASWRKNRRVEFAVYSID